MTVGNYFTSLSRDAEKMLLTMSLPLNLSDEVKAFVTILQILESKIEILTKLSVLTGMNVAASSR